MQEECFHLGAKALIFNEKNEVLILKTKRGYWDIPGGRLQKGESELQALKREIEEEIGLSEIKEATPFMMDLTSIRVQTENGEVGLIYSVFIVDVPIGFVPHLSDEHIEYCYVDPEEAASRLKEATSVVLALKNRALL